MQHLRHSGFNSRRRLCIGLAVCSCPETGTRKWRMQGNCSNEDHRLKIPTKCNSALLLQSMLPTTSTFYCPAVLWCFVVKTSTYQLHHACQAKDCKSLYDMDTNTFARNVSWFIAGLLSGYAGLFQTSTVCFGKPAVLFGVRLPCDLEHQL